MDFPKKYTRFIRTKTAIKHAYNKQLSLFPEITSYSVDALLVTVFSQWFRALCDRIVGKHRCRGRPCGIPFVDQQALLAFSVNQRTWFTDLVGAVVKVETLHVVQQGGGRSAVDALCEWGRCVESRETGSAVGWECEGTAVIQCCEARCQFEVDPC